jgi:NAD(P)-dependent dehydrogenase (short-subunit alcohol dehydrogenase family)
MPEIKTALVTGASSGFGRGIAAALAGRNMRVIAMARDAARLDVAAMELGVEAFVGDAADEATAARILQDRRPDLVVLCAGAPTLGRPLHFHTWETFSLHWDVDVKQTFVWLRNALLLPMAPGGHIVVVSSLAAVFGSPLSGGYAGAKRTQWLMAQYAAAESERLKLGIRLHCLLPALSPATPRGKAAAANYAARSGVSFEEYVKKRGPSLTPEIIGQAVVELHESPAEGQSLAYQIDADGLKAMT